MRLALLFAIEPYFYPTTPTETAENGSCRKPLPGTDRQAPPSRGEAMRDSLSRKSQSLVALRADASAYANRVRTGQISSFSSVI